jgi:ribosomal-protein-alanine N-acetyltransferase
VIRRHASHTPPEELLSELAAVEAASFPRPWGKEALRATLAGDGTAVVYLPAQELEVGAYCLYRQLEGELEILQMATQKAAQRQGLGRKLLTFVLDEAARSGCVAAFLEVRRSNAPAIALYESAGFRPCGVRPGYYQAAQGAEDALLLRRDLP